MPSCYISSGFCPTGPTFSTTPTLAPTCSSSLVSSSASVLPLPPPYLPAPPGMHHQKRNEKFKMLSKAPSPQKQEMTQNIATRYSMVFYLQPSHSPTDTCWYTRQPQGKTTLNNLVPRLCKLAGIEGYKTNHSLRATAATRLYQSGADEQQIMERTGHRSLEGVRSYKRTSEQQEASLSLTS